ncbi:MAG: FG-GAP repeat protein, partial [uncultured bacterium]
QAGIYVGGGGDINADGYDDFIVGARLNDDASADAGAAYVIYGKADTYTATSLSTQQEFEGASAGELAGEGVDIAGDVNNDGYDDIIVGAAQNDSISMNSGIVYLGYLTVDQDGDGVLGSQGIINPGTDCNDADATVSAEQTYYYDNDGDGLGSTETGTICSSEPTAGYADNADDTDDTIANNGVEISDDEIDNDGDGEIDEENSVDENSEHPGLGDTDPSDSDAFTQYVTSVVGGTNGSIIVTYSDNSVYRYTVFSVTTDVLTLVADYNATGYLVVLHPTSKKLALVNVYNGTVFQRLRLTKQAMQRHSLRLFDLRTDDVTDVIIVSSRAKVARVMIVQVDQTSETLTLVDRLRLVGRKIVPQRTSVSAKKITLKRKNKVVYTLRVNKFYNLVQQ